MLVAEAELPDHFELADRGHGGEGGGSTEAMFKICVLPERGSNEKPAAADESGAGLKGVEEPGDEFVRWSLSKRVKDQFWRLPIPFRKSDHLTGLSNNYSRGPGQTTFPLR